MAETPTPQAPGGMALGRFVMAKLQRAGVGFVQWVWRYSPGLTRPGGSFPQHRALAGTVHPEMPTSDGWEPGDHKGCRCGVTPRLRSLDTGRFVAAAVLEGDQP